jgi:hypothetical protein
MGVADVDPPIDHTDRAADHHVGKAVCQV